MLITANILGEAHVNLIVYEMRVTFYKCDDGYFAVQEIENQHERTPVMVRDDLVYLYEDLNLVSIHW
jgi:hypothetical protein